MIAPIENANEDLLLTNGEILVPRLKRQLTEIYTRVVGYLRPLSQFSKAKQLEHQQRKNFKV